MTAENDNALIIFSRLPIGHETKTRLAPILNETQRAELHLAMWRDIFADGYKRAVIIGADIPSVRAENISRAFDSLNDFDAVIGPSDDGGYWLIGMGKYIPEAFNVSSWGNSSVLDETARTLSGQGISYCTAETLDDIDTPEDINAFTSVERNKRTHTYEYITKSLPHKARGR